MRKVIFAPEPRPDLPHVTVLLGSIPVTIPEDLAQMATEHWAETMATLCGLDEVEVRAPVAGWLARPGLVAVRSYRWG